MICSRYSFLGLVFALAVLISCAPQAAPSAVPPALPPVAAPALSPEEAAWAQVVAAAKKEGTVNLYAFHFGGDVGRAIAQAFQDRYGIRVEILSQSSRPSIERVKVEQKLNQPWADILQSGTSSATEFSRLELGEAIWRQLPELKDKSVFRVDPVYSPKGDILWFNSQFLGILINTKLVKPQDEPRSYRDLLDPKWKGKVLMGDPRAAGTPGFVFFTTMRYYKVLDDDYFRRLVPQVTMWAGSNAELWNMVARGEFAVAPMNPNFDTARMLAEGAPLKVIDPAEGVVAQGEAINKVAGAAHHNAAKLFINWLFSKEGQTVYAKASSTTPLRKDVPDFLHPGARLNPQKILPRTWDVAEVGSKEAQEGVIERFFGKK